MSRLIVVIEASTNSRTSPAETAVVHPVSVVLVAFCWLESVGGADATMLLLVGKAAKVDFLTVIDAEPLTSAIIVQPVIVPSNGICRKAFEPVGGVDPPPSSIVTQALLMICLTVP